MGARDPELLNLSGETGTMTVFFCDLRGFTTLSHSLDPPTLVALLNEYMAAMTQVVFAYDGVLDKYIEDTGMAPLSMGWCQPARVARFQPGCSASRWPRLRGVQPPDPEQSGSRKKSQESQNRSCSSRDAVL
ncbi:MAG: adenylate/guanylate cyclase domain-containing protein [Nitrospira sp.]